jgi:hypothetical protein
MIRAVSCCTVRERLGIGDMAIFACAAPAFKKQKRIVSYCRNVISEDWSLTNVSGQPVEETLAT